MPSVYNCSVIELSKIHNRSGNITVIENALTIPFNVKRVYYLYDVPGGETRGGHGHKNLEQFIIAASGSFDVVLNDTKRQKVVSLNQPYYGLHVTPGIWRELINFSSGSICLVLTSLKYDEDDYIRNYDDYKEYVLNHDT